MVGVFAQADADAQAPPPQPPTANYIWFTKTWQVKHFVTRRTNLRMQGTQISFENGPFHGSMQFVFNAREDVGVFQLDFNCKGDPTRTKTHILTQMPGTGTYELTRNSGSHKHGAWDTVQLIKVD